MSDDDRDYVDIVTCAKRMNITPANVRELIQRRVLRAVNYGYGVLVEPAIVGGAV